MEDTDKQSGLHSGVVQMSFPAAGFCLVNPAGPNKVDASVICRLNTPGGLLGAGLLQAPVSGTYVTYKVQPGTDKAYIVSVNPQGTEPQGYSQEMRLHYLDDYIPSMSAYRFVKGLLQQVQDSNKNKEHATACIGQEDQYEGDLYFGDRYGPGIFEGRAQLTIKGSQVSYIEMSAPDDKINVVTMQAQLDTFSDKISISPSLNKTLKASGILEGMGGRATNRNDFPLTVEGDKPSGLKYTDDNPTPVFRNQTFQGGAAQGTHKVTIRPDDALDKVAVASQISSYEGEGLKFFAQGNCSIKTPFTAGLSDQPLKNDLDTEDGKKELEERKKSADKTLQNLKQVQLSDNGLQRTLQIDKILKDNYAQTLVAQMLGYDVLELLKDGVDPFTNSLYNSLDWDKDINEIQVGETMGEGPISEDWDVYGREGNPINRYANSSIITQDPDGSITLKDGWGSQITMSHGNIYISSALDTFIRPGRDLIQMVPEHCSLAANGEVEIASKKNIRVGAQKNLQLASAIAGGKGYTVLENRSSENDAQTGMVIRSNGKLTVTASDDMHIGINDKRTSNKGDAATYGKGSVFIEGEKVRVESRGELRLVGTQTGIYAGDSKSGGSGMELGTQNITLVSPNLSMDTGSIRMGNMQATYTVKAGPDEKTSITLNKGQGTLTVHVRGQLQCRSSLLVGSIIQAGGAIIGEDYMRWNTEELQKIPGVPAPSIKRFKTSLKQTFNTPMQNAPLKFSEDFQSWYNDNYICDRELSFMDIWRTTRMPSMCWQLLSAQNGFDKLKSISVKATGKDQTTYAYPGSNGWKSCQMSVITDKDTYAVEYSAPISTSYTTYTKGE